MLHTPIYTSCPYSIPIALILLHLNTSVLHTPCHRYDQTMARLSTKLLMKQTCTRAATIITTNSRAVNPKRRLSCEYWFSRKPHWYLQLWSLSFSPLTTSCLMASSLLTERVNWSLWTAPTVLAISCSFSMSTMTMTGLLMWLWSLKYLQSVSKLKRMVRSMQTLPSGRQVVCPSSLELTSMNSSSSLSRMIMSPPSASISNTMIFMCRVWLLGGFHRKLKAFVYPITTWKVSVTTPSPTNTLLSIYQDIQPYSWSFSSFSSSLSIFSSTSPQANFSSFRLPSIGAFTLASFTNWASSASDITPSSMPCCTPTSPFSENTCWIGWFVRAYVGCTEAMVGTEAGTGTGEAVSAAGSPGDSAGGPAGTDY